MEMLGDVLFILGSYFFGSLPHLHLLARLRRVDLGGDLHQSLWNRAGRLYGVIGVLGEFVKGALPVLAGRGLGLSLLTLAVAGLAAVCGQMWPVFSRFDGEKGNSIAIAMVIALAPLPALAAMAPIIIALLFRTAPRLAARLRHSGDKPIVGGSYSRSLPLGMAAYFLILPFIAWSSGEPAEIVWCTGALLLLIIVRRLTAGLGGDLNTGESLGLILLRRLLYDRPTSDRRR